VTGATLVSHPDGYPREKYEDGEDVEVEAMAVGGVFYAIGHEPNTDFLADTPVALDGDRYVQTSAGEAWATTETAATGVFAAGDVMDADYQQAVTAAGTGSMAALDVEEWLESAELAAADGSGPVSAEAGD
jgi:thioredoxin reductase (NADPH)